MAGTTSLAILLAVLDLGKAPRLTSKPILTWHVLTRFFGWDWSEPDLKFNWKRLKKSEKFVKLRVVLSYAPRRIQWLLVSKLVKIPFLQSPSFFEFCFFNYPILYVCFLCFTMFYYVLLYFWGSFFSLFEGNTLFQRLIYFPTMNKHQSAGKVHLSNVLNKSWFTVCIVFPSFRPAIWPHQHSHSKTNRLVRFLRKFFLGGSKNVFNFYKRWVAQATNF